MMQFTVRFIVLSLLLNSSSYLQSPAAGSTKKFEVIEATFTDIQDAITSKQITSTDLVRRMYLARIKAYNQAKCVNQPAGHSRTTVGKRPSMLYAGQLNALITLRPQTRRERRKWGCDDRKARSLTDPVDNNPNMPDALEVAAALDKEFARTESKLRGPRCMALCFGVKRRSSIRSICETTSGADADYATILDFSRPPGLTRRWSERLRDRGGLRSVPGEIGVGEYANGSRSAFGGLMCNPYDTTRDIGGSSGGSATSTAANLVTCSISEESGPSIRFLRGSITSWGCPADPWPGQPGRNDRWRRAERPEWGDVPHRGRCSTRNGCDSIL